MEKVNIFIDSGNFYHLVLKKLNLRELDFDFEKFVSFLAGDRLINEEGKRFYVATVREKQDGYESKNAMANQTSLFTELHKTGWVTKTSKLRTRREIIKIDDRVDNYENFINLGIQEIKYKRSREKGIDVKIAVDLMVGAIDNKYDTAILVSSDSDLIPAIDWVRRRGRKKVEYVGFSLEGTPSKEPTVPTAIMIYATNVQRVLTEADIRQFVKPTLFSV